MGKRLWLSGLSTLLYLVLLLLGFYRVVIILAMSPEPLFGLRGGRPLLSQQIVTLAFGAKHIPFGMLFIANDFGVPVIYIG